MTLALAQNLEDPARLRLELQHHWQADGLVGLALPQEQAALRAAIGPDGAALRHARERTGGAPALVIGSGGSSGGRRWCLQPLEHLQRSADASGRWLETQGLAPECCLHLAALPLHHISGLMPLIRVERWGAELRWLPPAWLREPERLARLCPLPPRRPVLLSLVPTQLQRLLAHPAGLSWLQGCRVIWLGGAAMDPGLALKARLAGLPLAPCYGATETAAMVCALPPARFLAGEPGCGPLFDDVELRLEGPEAAIAVRSQRLSPGWFVDGRLEPFAASDGWWRSGDAGDWLAWGPGASLSLEIRGRLDGAILSGGETVFPEQLEQQLVVEARKVGLGLEALLLLGLADPLWGERLVALVRPGSETDAEALLSGLARIVADWPAPQRPRRWVICPGLAPEPTGKWGRPRWRAWLAVQGGDSIDPSPLR